MADHPLRPATHRGLGEPLPHQQANGARAPPQALAFKKRQALIESSEELEMLCGISPPFGGLSPTRGQVTHVLLTRLPLYSPPEGSFLVRLACVKHAASVRSEPGSNSPVNHGIRQRTVGSLTKKSSRRSTEAERFFGRTWTFGPRTSSHTYDNSRKTGTFYLVFKEHRSSSHTTSGVLAGRRGRRSFSGLPVRREGS